MRTVPIESVSKIQLQTQIIGLEIDIMDTRVYEFILEACWQRELEYEKVYLSSAPPLAICVN